MRANRLTVAAWREMRDSPYMNWTYDRLPEEAKNRVNLTVAAVLREAAEELFEELLSRVEPGMVVRPNVIPELLRGWAESVERGEGA